VERVFRASEGKIKGESVKEHDWEENVLVVVGRTLGWLMLLPFRVTWLVIEIVFALWVAKKLGII